MKQSNALKLAPLPITRLIALYALSISRLKENLSFSKKKFIFYIVIYNILYNFATDWIHLLGRDIFEMSFIYTHIYRGVEKVYVTLI